MHGFGPVPVEPEEPLFHAAWEGRVLAMQRRGRRAHLYNLDEFRHAIERMPAVRYLAAGYYERWLTAIETLLLEKGLVTPEELATGSPGKPARRAATTPAASPLRARAGRPDPQHPPRRAYAAPALRPGAQRRGPVGARPLPSARHQR